MKEENNNIVDKIKSTNAYKKMSKYSSKSPEKNEIISKYIKAVDNNLKSFKNQDGKVDMGEITGLLDPVMILSVEERIFLAKPQFFFKSEGTQNITDFLSAVVKCVDTHNSGLNYTSFDEVCKTAPLPSYKDLKITGLKGRIFTISRNNEESEQKDQPNTVEKKKNTPFLSYGALVAIQKAQQNRKTLEENSNYQSFPSNEDGSNKNRM